MRAFKSLRTITRFITGDRVSTLRGDPTPDRRGKPREKREEKGKRPAHIPLKLIVHESLLNFALCAHDKWSVLHDPLFERFARNEDESSPPRRRRRLEPDAGLAFVVGQDGRVVLLDRFGRGE